MKTSTINFTIMAFGAAFLLTSCRSPEQKEDAAKQNVNEANQDLQETQQENNLEAKQAASAEEWKEFKTETELKINKNDERIAELKAKMNKPGKTFDKLYANRIETLEQKNKEMREKLFAYEKEQSDWASFKREFNHDMDELGTAINDLTVDNKN